jgi:NAD(P)-dependent dehydrogenase (short-subunit alcohol dehydrogenase family)
MIAALQLDCPAWRGVAILVLVARGIGVTVICPGPVGSTSDTPRMLFGPKGKISRLEQQDKRRMAPARAVQLMANAMAAGVEEAWLAKQPVLTMGESHCSKSLKCSTVHVSWLLLHGVCTDLSCRPAIGTYERIF